jgi:hypothetical protein
MTRRLLVALTASLLAVTGAVAALATAAGPREDIYVPVAHGKFPSHTWDLAFGGYKNKRCTRLGVNTKKKFRDEFETCDPDRPPEDNFQPSLGFTDNASNPGSVRVLFTRKDVGKLKIRLGPFSNFPHRWITVKAKRLSTKQAHKARVKRNFRYAIYDVHGGNGDVCEEQIIVYDLTGNQIEDSGPRACEI